MNSTSTRDSRRNRGLWLLVAALLALPLVIAVPATAEDNAPGGPQGPQGCPLFFGAPEGTPGTTAPHGSLKTVFPGGPPLPGTAGIPGVYMCSNGSWMLVAPWTGGGSTPIFNEPGAPTLTPASTGVAVAEGSAAGNSGTLSTTGDTPVVLSASVGTVTDGGDGTWAWTYPATDGPGQSQNVVITATAGAKVGSTTFELNVDNVAPNVTSVTPDRTTALLGQPVTFTGAGTDGSPEDAAAGFAWTFDGAAATGATHTTSFANCGTVTVSATATDKDGASSAEATSAPVTVTDAGFAAPLRAGTYNVVQPGRVVPVKVDVGCGGQRVTGLAPSIQLIKGDVDPSTDPSDPSLLVPVTNASGSDTTGVMRPVGDGYHYNLRVPDGPAQAVFTIRVRPFADSSHAILAVLKLKK